MKNAGFPLRLAALLVCLVFASGASAAEAPKKPAKQVTSVFRTDSASLRAEAAKAEFCVVFNKTIKTGDRGRFLSALDLRKEGKKVRLTIKDISLSPKALCVQNLEHGSRYDFLLRRIKSAAGLRLAQPYDAAFVVPDRKPFLAFVSDSNLSILPRHVKDKAQKEKTPDLFRAGMAHVLRSVNIEQTHLTLFQIPDLDSLADAWQQFTLINLSPSESLFFARTKGKALFESDLIFSANPNVEQTLVAPLPPDADLAPGLYYLAATPKAQEQSKPGLFAGQWFLVSDLRLSALRLSDGIEVFAGDLASRKPAANVEVRLLARDGEALAEGKTGANGVVFIPTPKEIKKKIALLSGHLPSGDIDILDVGRDLSIDIGALPPKAYVRTDRAAYQPGSTAAVALRAEDNDGQSLEIKESVLKLLRPDHRPYNQQIVPSNKGGVSLLNVPLPIVGKAGTWFLSWQRPDGAVIAETPLLLARDASRTKLEIISAREEDSSVGVFLKALDAQGKPMAFKTGLLSAFPASPEVSGYKSFRFGLAVGGNQKPLATVPFMTGADGMTHVSVPLKEKEGGAVDALTLQASLDEGGEPVSTTTPVHRFSSLIGVRSLTEGRSFAENGIARFDVIAVDHNGKRRAENDLYYLIYEEGRNFEWFPSEGHWDYRPLPQHRRVGGGPLSIAASGETIVRWPVTTGQYVIEIINSNGAVLARHAFEAGRVAPFPAEKESARLSFVSSFDHLKMRKKNRIKIKLEAPAFVSSLVFDGHARMTSYRFMKAGENVIEVTPTGAWGHQALVRVQALFVDSLVPTTIDRRVDIYQPARELAIKANVPKQFTTGAGIALPVRVQKIQGRTPTFVSVLATPLAADGNTDLPLVRQDRVPLNALGRAQVKLNLPLFEGSLRLTFFAWNEAQYGEKTITVPARPALVLHGEAPQHLGLGDRVKMPLRMENNDAPSGHYKYELHLPDGIVADKALSGDLLLNKGNKRTLSFSLHAKEPVEGLVRFDLKGPDGAQISNYWPVSVQAAHPMLWAFVQRRIEEGKKQPFPDKGITKVSKQKTIIGFLAPLALPDLMGPLQRLSLERPSTTRELVLWLEAARLWEAPLVALGLISELRFELLRTDTMHQLQLRQNDDGGFAPLRSGQPSDMISTAAALTALHGRADRPAVLAIEWLDQKLQNTWFEEEEREERVIALEALARVGRADLSVLRYFSETSHDKDLSARASAALGLALVQGGDAAAAQFWIDRARAAALVLAEKDPRAYWAVMRYLAANESMAPVDLNFLLTKGAQPKAGSSFAENAHDLSAWARTVQRFGPWSVQIDGKEEKVTGLKILVANKEEAGWKKVFLSASPKRYLLEIAPRVGTKARHSSSRKEDQSVAIDRAFVKLNGEKIDFDLSLMAGDTYLLLLRGQAEGKERQLRLVLPKSEAYDVVIPQDPNALRAQFPWLPESLTFIESGAVLPTGYALSFKAAGSWQLALMLRARRRGEFALPPVKLLSATGEQIPVNQNALRFSVW